MVEQNLETREEEEMVVPLGRKVTDCCSVEWGKLAYPVVSLSHVLGDSLQLPPAISFFPRAQFH